MPKVKYGGEFVTYKGRAVTYGEGTPHITRVPPFTPPRNWALLVYTPAMVFKVAYSWTTNPITVDGLGAFTPETALIDDLVYYNTANGDSLEATWLGDSRRKALNIRAHDRIIITTLGYQPGEDTGTYYQRWRGYASIPGNPNHVDGMPHQYRALGLSRLFESTDTGENYPYGEDQDLASVANGMIHDAPDGLPAGVTPPSFATGLPPIGVRNAAKVNPGSASLAENLQALTTLAEGGGVEAEAGVKPNGDFYFEPRNTSTVSINEATTGTRVQWAEPQADEIISGVRWVISDGSADKQLFRSGSSISLTTPDTLSHRTDSGITEYGQRVVPLSPPSEMQALTPAKHITYNLAGVGTLVSSYVGASEDSTPTLERIHDDNPTSYAVIEGAPSGSGNVLILRASFDPGIEEYAEGDFALVTLNIRLDETSERTDSCRMWLRGRLNGSMSANNDGPFLIGDPNRTGFFGTPIESPAWSEPIVFGDRARNARSADTANDLGYIDVEIGYTSPGTVRWAVEDFRIWVLNRTELDALAEQEYKFPQEDAFDAIIRGPITPGGLARITKRNGTTVGDLPVTALGVRIASTTGIQSLVTVGPRTPAHVTEEQNRIKARDGRATLHAAKAGRRRY